MKRRILPYLFAGSIAVAAGCTNRNIYGTVTGEALFEPTPRFGLIYRVELTDKDGKTTPMFSIDAEKILPPSHIKKL